MDLLHSPSNASQTTVCGSQGSGTSSSRWTLHVPNWEDCISEREVDAEEMLRTITDPNEIQTLCFHFPFHPKTLLEILSKRSQKTLNNILESLDAKCNDDETKQHKAEIILKLINPDLPDPPIWDSNWRLPTAMAEMDATKIAGIIESKMFSELLNVPFLELVRVACDRSSDAVTALLRGLFSTSAEFQLRIQEFDEPKGQYELVRKELIGGNPLAYWAVSQAISESPGNPYDALDFILRPIRYLFRKQELPLMAMLTHQKVLGILYRDDITNFESFKPTDFSFLEDISSKPTMVVARLITDRDVACFRPLCAKDFLSGSTSLSEISLRWSRLADVVKACCIVNDNKLVGLLSKVTKHLLRARNFYSALAFLTGMANARCYPKSLSTSWKYISTENLYTFYQKEWSRAPALPFLFPHINNLRTTGGREALLELLQFKRYCDTWIEFENREREGWARLYPKACSLFKLVAYALLSLPRRWIRCPSFLHRVLPPDIEKGG